MIVYSYQPAGYHERLDLQLLFLFALYSRSYTLLIWTFTHSSNQTSIYLNIYLATATENRLFNPIIYPIHYPFI